TVVLVKPDGVKRAMVGEIIARFEKMGLKIAAMKMVWVDKGFAGKHYPEEREELLRGIGEKTLSTYEKYGKDAGEDFGTKDALEIGKIVNRWNMEFLSSGPVIAILLEGPHAIDNVRAIAGATLPVFALPGTIRGDLSLDSPALANAYKRAVRNLVHASGNAEEAEYEKQLWFRENEIHSYRRVDEGVMFEKE
ncbi:nucleoside-diphosphate kinase, partial [Patescibacteria group bacterium]|nr:nucleoside-diphosphate kinase [Patescibacteria group bacterium]MBU1922115.1 nucleoside-diphosphate kinase [Patescibacteria group bacterium]